jgi:hypothetical protein
MHTRVEKSAARKMHAHLWKQEPNKFYIEDEWVSHALFGIEEFPVGSILDPFCGTGRILNAAARRGYATCGYDVIDRGCKHQFRKHDALELTALFHAPAHIVTNPPYDRDLLRTLLPRMRAPGLKHKAALFMPLAYLAGKAPLLRAIPLARLWVCRPRPNCLPGKVIARGEKAQGGRRDFAWFVFDPDHQGDPKVRFLDRKVGE